MTEDIQSLGQKRAEKNNDASLWTPEEAYQECLRLCKNKKITKTVIIYEYNDEKGNDKMGYVSAGVTSRSDAIGLIAMHQHWACADSLGE